MSDVNHFFPATIVLPTMPEVATKLLKTFGDDNASLDSLAAVISKDQGLVGKVLRLANSARYSPAHNISSLSDATAALGTDTLRNLALSACIAGAFPTVPGIDRKKYWRHSLLCAHYAVLLSRAVLLDTETAYLAGLMLRSGELLMAQTEPAAVSELESHVTEPGVRFGWELTRFGCAHSHVTAELARRWQFPKALVYGFATAAEPLEAKPFSLLGAVLHMSEVLADATDLGVDPMASLQAACPDLLEHEHLDLAWVKDHLPDPAELAQEVELMAGG